MKYWEADKIAKDSRWVTPYALKITRNLADWYDLDYDLDHALVLPYKKSVSFRYYSFINVFAVPVGRMGLFRYREGFRDGDAKPVEVQDSVTGWNHLDRVAVSDVPDSGRA